MSLDSELQHYRREKLSSEEPFSSAVLLLGINEPVDYCIDMLLRIQQNWTQHRFQLSVVVLYIFFSSFFRRCFGW